MAQIVPADAAQANPQPSPGPMKYGVYIESTRVSKARYAY